MVAMAVAIFSANAAESYLSVTPNRKPEAAKYAVQALDYTQITSLETTANGRLWASLLGGGDSANGFLTLAYSDTNGSSWIEPTLALDARAEYYAVRNGVLWRSPKGALWLFYAVFDGYYDGRGSMWAMQCANPDAATPVWGEPAYLGVGIPTGKPQLDTKGNWVLPVALWGREVITYDCTPIIANKWMRPRFASPYIDKYTELDAKRGAGVYISSDEGRSWQEHLGVVKCAQEVENARYNNPQLFRHADGQLGMVVRASGTAWTFGARSANGVEWSEPARFVAAPDQNFAIHTLADGKLLMVRNARFDRHLYWSREGIYAYLSEDGGETWYGGLRVATDEVSINPVVAEGANGVVYIAYHSDPEGNCVNTLLTTSVAEIDAATADYKNSPKGKQQVLTSAKSLKRAAAERALLTAQKGDWATETIRLATYNIQYPKMDWSGKRMAALIPLLKDQKFDVFGAQEPFLFQIEDMMAHIGDEYAWVGSNISGDDNDRGHHFDPIFYRKERVELLDYATVWLSDQKAVAGYGAYSARLFTWAKFRDKKTDKVFFFFNGHYDHRGVEARENASHIVLDMVKRIAKGMPAFVTADYNSGEDSKPYKILQSSWLLKDTMLDAEEAVNKQYQSHSANYTSVTLKAANGRHIDHIFYTPNAVHIKKWELIVKEYAGFFGSDHLPIYIDCLIAN